MGDRKKYPELRQVPSYQLPALLVGCFVLWLAFVGTLRRNELVVGAGSVVLAIAFFTLVERRQEINIKLRPGDAVQCLWIPWYLVVGLLEILAVLGKDLARVQRAKSLFLVTRFRALPGPTGAARRVLAVLYTTVTPNFIVISIDPDEQEMLYHQLDKSNLPRMTSHLGAVE